MSHGLNLAQQEAVNYMHGPCLVLAGAGSGKTRVITHKIGRLIQAGMEPQRIAAITFTNKAAAEMRERAKDLIGKDARKVVVCTFHALGVRMMREDGAVLGLKKAFSILDSDDVTKILKDAGGSTDTATARIWQWTISKWKNMGLSAAQAEAAAVDDNERITAKIMGRYEERLLAYQSVDFDDLIGMPLKLLYEFPEVRAKWQAALGHILVDEYQDTNATQYEVLKALAGEHGQFTAVGDDDQSIYGWRGATLDNLRKLPVDYPKLKVIKLEQNYRSTSAILRAANNVIGPNPKLFPKTLFSELGEGEPVRIVDADSEVHEAERAVARIVSIRAGDSITQGKQHKEFRDFAILYRANHQARVFEQALRKAQIPYKVSGGQSFFDRAEIKDLCGWFRLWVNNDDDPAFLRAITTPKRGIGHTTLASLGDFASQYKLSLFEALFSPSLPSVMPKRTLEGIHEFGRYINDLEYRARRTIGAEDARAFMLDWLKDIDYEKHLYDGEDSEAAAASRWTNVLEFCRLDGAARRRHARRHLGRRQQHRDRAQEPARSGADHLAAVHHQRAPAGPGRGHAVHPARLQGPGVAARDAHRRDRRPAALQARRRQRPPAGGERRHAAAPAGRAPPHVRGHHPRPAQPGRELDQEAQAGPRDGACAAEPLHRRDGAWTRPPPRKTRAKSSRPCAPSSRARRRTAPPRRAAIDTTHDADGPRTARRPRMPRAPCRLRPRRLRHPQAPTAPPTRATCRCSRCTAAGRPASTACPPWPRCSWASTPTTTACAAPSRATRATPGRGRPARGRRGRRRRALHRRIAGRPRHQRRVVRQAAGALVRPRVQGHVAQRRRPSTHPFVLSKTPRPHSDCTGAKEGTQ
jgi:ATP-dependent DNA helicase Rep